MLGRSVITHTKILCARKSVIFVYLLMLGLVLFNFFTNLSAFSGQDVIDITNPVQILFLTPFQSLSTTFLQFFPFLVIIPCSFAYMDDKNANTLLFLQARCKRFNYYFGKMIAVFLVTFLVFTTPLLMEILLNFITYPSTANGTGIGFSVYSEYYIDMVNGWFFTSLYVLSPYLYAVFFNIVFGLVCGVFAVFAMAISTLDIIKFKIILFLPVYLLLTIVNIIPTLFGLDIEGNYFFYLRLFDSYHYNGFIYFLFMLLVLLLSVFIVYRKSGKDTI